MKHLGKWGQRERHSDIRHTDIKKAEKPLNIWMEVRTAFRSVVTLRNQWSNPIFLHNWVWVPAPHSSPKRGFDQIVQ